MDRNNLSSRHEKEYEMKTVFFDLHDTLMRFNESFQPYNELTNGLGLTAEQQRLLIGAALIMEFPTVRHYARFVKSATGKKIPLRTRRKVQEGISEHLKSGELMPGAMQTFDALKSMGWLLAVISNLETPYKYTIERLGIDRHIDGGIYSCEIGYAKPHPQIFRIALQKMKIDDPRDAVMVGDNQVNDVEAAERVGMKAILFDPNFKGCNQFTATHLTDVPQMVP